MRVKRFLSALLTICMLIPLIPAENAWAEDKWEKGKWEYWLTLHTSSSKNAEANVKDTKTLKATLTFSDGGSYSGSNDGLDYNAYTKSSMITNQRKKDVDERFDENGGWLQCDYAPWSLRSIKIENLYKDVYQMYSIKIKARYVNDTKNPNLNAFKNSKGEMQEFEIFSKIPHGENDKHSGGPGIHLNGPLSYDISVGRSLTSKGNFYSQLGKLIHLTANDKNDKTVKNITWDGSVTDKFAEECGKAHWYNIMKESDKPTFAISDVKGITGTGNAVTFDDLTDMGIQTTENGWSYTPSTLFDKMGSKRIGKFSFNVNLVVCGKSVGATTVNIIRDTFDFNNTAFKNVNYSYTQGKDTIYYYTKTGDNSKNKNVNVELNISYESAIAMCGGTDFSGLGKVGFSFDEAYIETRDSNNNEVKKYAAGTSASNQAGNASISGRVVKMSFPYVDGDDTGNTGLKLVIKGGKITINNRIFKLYDKKNGTSDVVSDNLTYRIDAKSPQITLERKDNATGYAKTAVINVKADEDSYLKTTGTDNRAQKAGEATISLADNSGNILKSIRGYNIDISDIKNKNYNTGYTSQTIGLTGGGDGVDVKLSLTSMEEGEFKLIVEGADKANNTYKAEYPGIKLDNKAPQTACNNVIEGRKTDDKGNIKENVSNKYYINVKDGSGEATLWYMFTQVNVEDAKKVGINETTGEDGSTNESGDLNTLLGRWSQIKMSDIKEGKEAEVVITMTEGKKFNGNLIWYAVDSCGNKSGFGEKKVKIENESTAYEILPSNISVYKPSYEIEVVSPNNTVSYRWRKATASKGSNDDYLFTEYRTARNGVINTKNDEETAVLDGEYVLELKIQTPSGGVTLYPQKNVVFDGAGPDIRIATPTTYTATASATINIDDRAGVIAATGIIAAPDGSEIDGQSEFTIPVENGAVENYAPSISNLESGAYAIKVTATDINGQSSTVTSSPFYVRNGAPTGSVKVTSDYTHGIYPIIRDGKSLKLTFDITESFNNASNVQEQVLYYRVDGADAAKGHWREAGTMKASGDMLTFIGSTEVKDLDFIDGRNELFIETTVYPKGTQINRVNTANISEHTDVFYMDEIPPETPVVIIGDVHTTESISGWIDVGDNSFDFEGALTAECDENCKDSVEIGDYNGAAFPIKVNKNVKNAKIYIYDEAHNKSEAVFSIYGIDTEAPDISFSEKPHGVSVGDETMGRTDAEAMLTIDGMTGDASFALIKEKDLSKAYKNDTIDDDYFAADFYDDEGVFFTVTKTHSENSYFDNETDNIYKIKVSGSTGNWYLGVRATDALGNTADVVFDDNPFEVKDAAISIKQLNDDGRYFDNWTVTPETGYAELAAVVTANFNVPVYVLPQNMIIPDGTEEENLALAAKYAMTYSQAASFTVKYAEDGSEYRTYHLYAVDDLGRTAHITIDVTEEIIPFNSSGDVLVGTYVIEDGEFKAIAPEKVCAQDTSRDYYVIVEPNNADTLLLPAVDYFRDYLTTHGLLFASSQSYDYAIDENGNSILNSEGEYNSEFGETRGYTKLVYEIYPVEIPGKMIVEYADIEYRAFTVRTFNKNIDPNDEANKGLIGERVLVVSGIDNTAPIIKWSTSPEVLSEGLIDAGDEFKDGWITHPTIGNVTFTLTAQDKESGIDTSEIVALTYTSVDGEECEIKVVPDEEGYWSWNGEAVDENGEYINKLPVWEWDRENGHMYLGEKALPLTITYSDEPSDEADDTVYGEDETSTYTPEPKGKKVLTYTFTGPVELNFDSGMSLGYFRNTLGAISYPSVGRWENGFSTMDIILKTPIEEGADKDYIIVYKDKNGDIIENMEDGYRNSATAVIKLQERGKQRGLYVANNSRSDSVELSIYRKAFTFNLKDKYGYEATAEVQLANTDTIAPTIDYALSETGKTNKPISIAIYPEDGESGIASVTLGGTETIALTEDNGEYLGQITRNGTYNIAVYDKSGNKSVKSFTVANVNTETTTASVTFSSSGRDDVTVDYNDSKDYNGGDSYYTSRPVTATLTFSKANVKITSVTPIGTLTESDYSINYGTSEITFLKSGTVEVDFADDYGNVNTGNTITVQSIDKTPPQIEEESVRADGNSVDVTFALKRDLASGRDKTRNETEVLVAYGGVAKPIAYEKEDEKGNKTVERNVFTFTENGYYTLKVYDKDEPLSSYYTLEVKDIDRTAPKITLLEWWYGDDETSDTKKTITPAEGAVGYRVATDVYERTKEDVTVRITTGDKENEKTKLSGTEEEYSNTHTRVYDENGMFTFNAEKKNGQITSYGVDIAVIDKTPPVIDFGEATDLMYYENPEMNEGFDLQTALNTYKAYDVFNGVATDLTKNVKISYYDKTTGRLFDHINMSNNKFDSSKPYTVTYTVEDEVGNVMTAYRTVRLVGKNDTIVTINGMLPDSAGKVQMSGDTVNLALKNFSRNSTAYVKYQKGLKTMGEMKTGGEMLVKNKNGEYVKTGLTEGWHTFYIQTDKRDYFTIGVYTAN